MTCLGSSTLSSSTSLISAKVTGCVLPRPLLSVFLYIRGQSSLSRLEFNVPFSPLLYVMMEEPGMMVSSLVTDPLTSHCRPSMRSLRSEEDILTRRRSLRHSNYGEVFLFFLLDNIYITPLSRIPGFTIGVQNYVWDLRRYV